VEGFREMREEESLAKHAKLAKPEGKSDLADAEDRGEKSERRIFV
jgi:hypothetical protein